MKRIVISLLLLAALFAATACDALGLTPAVSTSVPPVQANEATPEPAPAQQDAENAEAQATPAPDAPASADAPAASGGEASMTANITVGGENTDITLKRQESTMGYAMYVWEDRIAYQTEDGREIYTLSWQGMKLPEVTVSVELVGNTSVSGAIDSTAMLISEGGGIAELMGEVSKPAYLMNGTLLRGMNSGDFDMTTDAFLVDNGEGGVFRIVVHYFPEAMEDAGQAVAIMLGSFEVIRR